MTTNLFVITNIKQLRTGGSFTCDVHRAVDRDSSLFTCDIHRTVDRDSSLFTCDIHRAVDLDSSLFTCDIHRAVDHDSSLFTCDIHRASTRLAFRSYSCGIFLHWCTCIVCERPPFGSVFSPKLPVPRRRSCSRPSTLTS
jgi:hypothetical protein